jgi:8-amino-7-oxononanoate synthase
MPALEFLAESLADLEADGLLRIPQEVRHSDFIDVCSNDYLGLARAPVSRATLLACEGMRAGAGASRLIHGTAPEHVELERECALWTGHESALLFSTGYQANVGLIQALCRQGDRIVSDQLNHASLIDGCRLSAAEVVVVPHRDLPAVERALSEPRGGRAWVLTESYFSMDGDVAPLAELRQLCDDAGAGLIVDEAHALGVFGPQGGGLCRAAGIVPDVLVGTLGKAVGVQGAFVAGSANLRLWLWNRARSLVFSTAPTPLVARLALEHIRLAQAADAERERLAVLGTRVRSRLRDAGLRVGADSRGPIVPLIFGDSRAAVDVARRLLAQGILVQAIRPPTVPKGSARLRVTLSSSLTDDEVERVLTCLVQSHGGS